MTAIRPVFLKEGPANACVLHGRALGWTLCTNLSAAMLIDRSTRGRIRISGCQVRDETGDYIGGTTLPQNATVCEAHGVKVEQHVGPNVCTSWYAGYQASMGRAFILQGNTSAIGKGNVNHAVLVNEVDGPVSAGVSPKSAFVFDPWSSGPAWWSWDKVKAFAAELHPWGEADPRTLGPGRFYAGFGPTTRIPSLWGPDVPLAVQAVDPSGQRAAALFRKAHSSYGAIIELADLLRMFAHYHVAYGSVVDAADLVKLFGKAGV